MSFWQIYVFVKNSKVFGFLLVTHNLRNSSYRVFSQLGNSGNSAISIKDKMNVERKFFFKT